MSTHVSSQCTEATLFVRSAALLVRNRCSPSRTSVRRVHGLPSPLDVSATSLISTSNRSETSTKNRTKTRQILTHSRQSRHDCWSNQMGGACYAPSCTRLASTCWVNLVRSDFWTFPSALRFFLVLPLQRAACRGDPEPPGAGAFGELDYIVHV